MDGHMFGEGLTLLGNKLFQVTWLKNDGFIYDRYNFSKRKNFTHTMRDGWGLATDGKVLFGSDGTSKLYQLDPKSLEVTKMVTVKYQDNEIPFINELEYIDGEVWANVWQTDCIARVTPQNGQVVSWIFLHDLRRHLWNSGNRNIDVLNGIAWDEEKHRLFVTGKLWPKLYEIKLRPVDGPADGSVENLCPKASFY
jgi:glutamine cyclotransferase